MRLSMISAIVILFFTLLILVFITYVFFRKKYSRVDAFWLLKNDKEIAGIVSSLSFLTAFRTHRNFISKKKLDLIIRLRHTILRHMPDSNPEDIDIVCNDLIKIVERIRKKRSELLYK